MDEIHKTTIADRLKLSVIIPAYNEQERLPYTLSALSGCIEKSETEIIIVCDGCTDNTAGIITQWAAKLPLRTISYHRNRGKGYAVKQGVAAANGQIIAFMDADGAAEPSMLKKLILPVKNGTADIVIASRRAKGANVIKQPLYRLMMGKTLSLLTRMLLHIPFLDTQCGMKVFSRISAKYLFQQTPCDGFEFDLDILYRAYNQKFRIMEMGIDWKDIKGSKVNPWRDGIKMLNMIMQIHLSHLFSAKLYKTLDKAEE